MSESKWEQKISKNVDEKFKQLMGKPLNPEMFELARRLMYELSPDERLEFLLISTMFFRGGPQ